MTSPDLLTLARSIQQAEHAKTAHPHNARLLDIIRQQGKRALLCWVTLRRDI